MVYRELRERLCVSLYRIKGRLLLSEVAIDRDLAQDTAHSHKIVDNYFKLQLQLII